MKSTKQKKLEYIRAAIYLFYVLYRSIDSLFHNQSFDLSNTIYKFKNKYCHEIHYQQTNHFLNKSLALSDRLCLFREFYKHQFFQNISTHHNQICLFRVFTFSSVVACKLKLRNFELISLFDLLSLELLK